MLKYVFYILASLCLVSCYQQETDTLSALSAEENDSLRFYKTHHYTIDYDFVVKADSLSLIVQQPSEAVSGMLVDTIVVMRHDPLVVADIMVMPADTVDSVWVEVARDQQTIGWIHEQEMLEGVTPDNPISMFIDFFSHKRPLIIGALLVLVAAVFVVVRLLHKRAPIVHFNDIGTFYPTLLALLVASSSSLLTTIQMAGPESWRHYYYHPTLNPFVAPLQIGLFIATVWAILVVAIAAVSDVQRRLPAGKALVYYMGLLGVCAFNYVFFAVATYYYLGYPLLILYAVFAIWRYYRHSRTFYLCGQCGYALHKKGICPHCGAMNI